MVGSTLFFSFVALLLVLPAFYSHYQVKHIRVASVLNILLHAVLLPIGVISLESQLASLLVALASVGGILNSFRALASINSDHYVHHQMARTGISLLVVLFAAVFSELVITDYIQVDEFTIMAIYAAMSLAIATVTFVNTFLSIRKKSSPKYETKQVPSVTIAIPARNEDATLEANLHTLLESTYPKLEILVIDDCSHDNTAQIIKSFAHRGVRFLNGGEPQEDWLGKNYAYQQLLEQASGDYILFLGADISISKEAVSELVARTLRGNLKMLSVLPVYKPNVTNWKLWDVAQQVARYFWQLGVIRVISSAPAVVGSCLLIERETLLELGGFKALRHMVEPERFFAQKLVDGGHYQLISSKDLISDVISTKDGQAQMNRTVRIAYPLLHRDVTYTMIASLAIVLFLIVPISVLALLPFLKLTSLVLIVGSAGLMLLLGYIMIYLYVAPWYALIAPVMIFVTSFQYLVLITWSLLKYEFIGVQWKGRNVCIPVLDLKFLPAPKRKHRGRRHSRRRRRS